MPSLQRKWFISIFESGIFKFLQELEQRLREEVAAKEEAEKSVDLLKTEKEKIVGKNEVNFSLKSVFIWYRKFFTALFQKLKNQLAQEELKLGEARIMQTLHCETIRQLQCEKVGISYKLLIYKSI